MGSVPVSCDLCDGFGYFTDAGEDDSPPPVATYEAVTVGGTLESALTLDGLKKAMRDWRLADEDVAVFRVAEGRGCRIVGAFVPDGKGGMALRLVDGVPEAK